MPFSLQVDGLKELAGKLDKLPEKAADVAALALYDGAGTVADRVRREVQGISTEPFRYAQGGRKRKASPEEKELLMNAPWGIAKFKRKGVVIETSVGMENAGYADLAGKRVPIPQIANAINSGTSFREKQPFLRKAFTQSRKAAEAAIEAGIKAHEDLLDIGD